MLGLLLSAGMSVMPGVTSGPLEVALASHLPGVKVDRREPGETSPRGVRNGRLYLTAPATSLEALDEERLEEISRAVLEGLDAEPPERGVIRGEAIWVRSPGRPYAPITAYLPPPPPVPDKPREVPPLAPSGPPADAPGVSAGSLSGKTIYMSQGHGFVWDVDLGHWGTQRGNTHGIVEDLVNAEAINQYLVHYLENAGAQVFTVRERDMKTPMVIVDDGEDGYAEVGATERFSPSALPGWGAPPSPMTQGDLPFELGTARVIATAAEADATARWVPEVPAAGTYTVYVSYVQGPGRAIDAHYRVLHTGGAVDVRIDQTRHGSTWVSLGRFHFAAGSDAAAGAIELLNDAVRGATVSADAVRLGGGRGDVDRGGGISGRPAWEQAARYYTQYTGAPASVFNPWTSDDHSDDVSSRSRYAAWEHPDGEDAVYVSWHTNAPDGGLGTSSYVYGPNPPDGTYDFTGTAGSDDLVRFVHDEIVGDIRAAWDPGWRDRGVFSAYFGEINPSHNDEMPSCLIEVAFHATEYDADQLREPRFRALVSRSMTQGIIRYFADRDGVPPDMPPEPPTHLRVRGVATGSVEVAWRPAGLDPAAGDPAARYRVYASADGAGFGLAAETADTTVVLDFGADRQTPIFVRVTAVNDGGESFPTETLGALAAEYPAPVLVVNGFDRLDGFSLIPENLAAWSLGVVDRMVLDRMNTFAYGVRHGSAIAALRIPFDAASNEAVADGDVALADWVAVDWITGEESTADETLSSGEQAKVSAYLDGGGRMVLSGAEIAWDLDFRGAPEDAAFLHGYFGAAYGADDAGVYDVDGLPGTFLAVVPPLTFDNGAGDVYAVGYPDVLAPVDEGFAVLAYAGGSDFAAVAVDAGHRAVVLGFPFEAVLDAGDREELMAGILSFLLAGWEPPTGGDDGGPSSDGGPPDDGGPLTSGDPSISGGDAVPGSGGIGGAGGGSGSDGGGGAPSGCDCAGTGLDGAVWWVGLLAALGRLSRSSASSRKTGRSR